MTLSVTERLAEVGTAVKFESISPDARELAKRLVIDALACGIGGYRSPTGRSAHDYVATLPASGEATLIGSGQQVSASAAIIANQAMLRYLDYNDDLPIPIGPGDLVAAHPSGCLPVALALAEASPQGGKALIEGMVAGYEVVGRLLAGFRVSLEVRGLHHGSTLTYGAAMIGGKMLGLTPQQTAHAMGIAGSLTVGLDILDAEGEEYTMTKNLADGLISERGYTAARLARSGFTSPLRIIEGNKGFAQIILGGPDKFKWDERNGGRPDGGEWILNTVIKSIPAEATNHGHLTATVALVNENKLTPDMIERVTVRTNKRTLHHTGDPIKKFPRNKETADHSTYFLTAMAIIDGSISIRTYREGIYDDATVHDLIGRIDLEYEPEFDALIPAGETVIRLKDGRTLRRRVDRHELAGEPSKRMSDEMLRNKFIECADSRMSSTRIDEIINKVLSLEKVDDFKGFMKLVVLDR